MTMLYRHQSINFQCKLIHQFLYESNVRLVYFNIKRKALSLIFLFPVCQTLGVFTAKVNEDEEGAMDTICKANEGAGRIAST